MSIAVPRNIFLAGILLHFDKLHAQYLDGVIAWAKAHPEKMQLSEPLVFTEFSSFDDPKGYSEFVPGSSWLRMMYDIYIEQHGAAMDQQAAMKSLRLGAGDHHYKTTKQIGHISTSNNRPFSLKPFPSLSTDLATLAIVSDSFQGLFQASDLLPRVLQGSDLLPRDSKGSQSRPSRWVPHWAST